MAIEAVAIHDQESPPVSSTELALQRTRMAFERTTMAWVRTAISLISFGFTIYKFFDLFKREEATSHGFFGPRQFALSMIGTGLFVLIAAVVQRWRDSRSLPGAERVRNSLASIVAGVVALMGILTFITVMLRE